ncbi:MAG: hypothetical protein KAR03_08055 [Candidatus Thorarchaeota archaeon]|nr:hypothetical protein [Candidatus Thorarchaeota archaeon]
MTSTSSVITKRDADSQVLSPILDKLDDESLKRLEPFIAEIEEYIQQAVSSVPQNKLRRRSRKALISAAIYDTFRVFEKRTKVRIRSEFIADCLGILMSVLNQNWRTLFDIRVKLDRNRIEIISGESEDIDKLVSEVVHSLQDALEEKTPEVQAWFNIIEEEAKDILMRLDRKRMMDYPPEIVAVAAVYGVVQCKGKPMVQLSQKIMSLTCSFSPAMISKVWLALFDEGRISGSI